MTKEALSASNLRITGDIDARDFKTLKEATISRTRVLDLSDANIKAYTGKEGCVTYKGSNWIVPAAKDYVYKANTFPINAFNERRDNSLNTWTAGSTSLRKIILPKTLEAFEPDAFYDNNNLTELVVPETSTKLKGEDGAIYSSDGRRLLVVAPGYTGHLDIPATVQSVDSCALAYARPASLRFHTVTPPDMLGKDLVNTAYIVCPSPANYSKLFPDIDCVSKISQIIVNDVKEGTLMETIGNLGYVRNDVRSVRVSGTISQEDCDALFSLKNLHHADLSGCTMTGNSVELPEGSLCEVQLPMADYNPKFTLYISANNYLQGKLDIPESVFSVECLNTRFSEIVFPSYLNKVYSFNDCIARRIDFSACTLIAEIEGFYNCANLEELILPPNLQKLNGFTYAPLTSIEIPSTVNYINTCGWDIRNIVLPESLEEIQEFSEMPYLEQVDASKCSNLSNVMYAFNDCPRLETLDLSNSPIDRFEKCCQGSMLYTPSVETKAKIQTRQIGVGGTNYPAPGFSGLKSIKLPSSLSYISGFNNCDMLTSLELAHCYRLESLSGLQNCSSLETLTLPAQLEDLSIWDGCTSLSKIYSAATKAPVFLNAPADEILAGVDLYVPVGSLGSYRMAEKWSDCRSIQEGGYSVSINSNVDKPLLINGAGLYEAGQTVELNGVSFAGEELMDYVVGNWNISGEYETGQGGLTGSTVSFIPKGNCLAEANYTSTFHLEKADIVWEIESPEATTITVEIDALSNGNLEIYSENGKLTINNKESGYGRYSVTLDLVPGSNKFGFIGEEDLWNLFLIGNGTAMLNDIKFNKVTMLRGLYINNFNMKNLDVSNCKSLHLLDVRDNELTNLDLSSCPNLIDLFCYNNQLTSINLNSCTELTYIRCENNLLTTLDLSSCSKLTELQCSGNKFTSLDLSPCKALESFYCGDNKVKISSLDFSSCTALTNLYLDGSKVSSLNLSSCTALTYLYLDGWDASVSSLNLSSCTALESFFCRDQSLKISSLDFSSCTALTNLDLSGSKISSLNLSSCTALTELSLNSMELTSLNLNSCTALTELDCSWGNELTSLDLSSCTALTTLYCGENELTSLDLSSCTALTTLYCGENELTSLYLSSCTALTKLDCSENELTSLDLSSCTALTELDCRNNELTSLNLNSCTALTELDCKNNELTSLDLSSCSKLTELLCSGNKFTSLDLSPCKALESFSCDDNKVKISSLDFSSCTALTNLYLFRSKISSLNLSSCTALTELSLYYMGLTSLDLSSCTALTKLDCSENELTSLDLSSCTALTKLDCSQNELTSLDLSSCAKLEVLNCHDNMLTSLKLVPNTPTEGIELSNNPSAFSLLNPYVYELIMKQANSDELGLAYKISEEISPEYCLFDLRRELTAEPYGNSTKVDFFNVSEVIEGETGVFRFKPNSDVYVIVEFSNPQFPNLFFSALYDAELANGIEETLAQPKWKLSVNDGVLNVSGLSGKTVAELYTVDGMFVDRVSTTDETVSVSVPNKGTVYLLRVTNGKNKHTYKITVP